jgi:hypothetical protein
MSELEEKSVMSEPRLAMRRPRFSRRKTKAISRPNRNVAILRLFFDESGVVQMPQLPGVFWFGLPSMVAARVCHFDVFPEYDDVDRILLADPVIRFASSKEVCFGFDSAGVVIGLQRWSFPPGREFVPFFDTTIYELDTRNDGAPGWFNLYFSKHRF